MKQKAEQIMRSNKECMADNYCTFRNKRICVPVKKEYKLKIRGSVIDKSATGNTLFIEPSGAAKSMSNCNSSGSEKKMRYTVSYIH